MIFWKKRQQEDKPDTLRHLENDISTISEDLNCLREELLGESHKTPWVKLREEIKEEMRRGRLEEEKWLRRQSNSFEDLLEELQAEKERENAAKRLLEEAEQREQALLDMVCCVREQMELLERQILHDDTLDGEKREAWVKQFGMMNRMAQKYMRSCEIEEVGTAGEPLDYDIHEVLALTDVAEVGREGTVAEVFSRGRIYRGRLVKKTQVSAYRKTTDKKIMGNTPAGELQEEDNEQKHSYRN